MFPRNGRPGRRDDRTALGMAFDLGAKPGTTEQLDPALAIATAEQTAINDAGNHVYDTAGLIGAVTPLLFDDRTAAEIRAEQAQASIRALSARLASRAVATSIAIGRDEGAIEPGVGLQALERRRDLSMADEERAQALVARAEEALVARGGDVPPRHDRRTLGRLLVTKWAVPVAAVLAEFLLLRQALLVATRTEDVAEAAAMAVAVLVATVVLPHFAAWALKAIRSQAAGAALRVLLVVMAAVWLGLIAWTADLRDLAARTEVSGGTVPAVQIQTAAQQGEDAGAASADASGTDAGAAGVPTLTWGFALMMVGISLGVLAGGLRHTDEEIAWVRLRRALDTRRAATLTATSHLQDVERRLEFQAEDAAAGDEAASAYVAVVLPRLGALTTEHYRGELARRVGDASFADALRALPRRFPVVVPAGPPGPTDVVEPLAGAAPDGVGAR